MPALEDKFKHIRKLMVRNFIQWAIFMALSVMFLAISFWKQDTLEMPGISQLTLFAIIVVSLIFAHYFPAFLIQKAPFNYHNDNGRMFAYRAKLGVSLFLLLWVIITESFYIYAFGINKTLIALILFTLLKAYKLRPTKNVWVDFRMRYRAGRTMPVRSR
ncbi:MAG: hypothetical protein H6696_10545 [Deferribacteres bacterium]|nr:hypothetical protein [candidate division KSB1 bacterium]MCB9502369.1 hypothetical protein [Deferribacteres bacterium]